MADRTLKVVFSGDVSALKKAIEDAGGTVKSVEAQVTGSSSKIGAALGGVGKIAAGVGLGNALVEAPGQLMEMARSAAEDEQSTAKLNAAIQTLGGNQAQITAQYDAAIAAGQEKAFTDDDERDALVQLTASTQDHDEALRRLSVAQDLARGTGMSLPQAALLLGKVTEDNITVFQRYGIAVQKGATEQDVLAEVQKRYAGQADAYADSTAGQFEKTQIQFDELKESIGYALIPIMGQLGSVLANQVVPAVQGIADTVVPVVTEAIGAAKSAIEPVVDFLMQHKDVLVAGLIGVGTAITLALVPAFLAWAAGAAAAAAATLLAAAPIVAIGLVIAGLVAGIVLLVTHWDQVTQKFPVLGTIADGVKGALAGFASWITGTLVPVLQSIYDKVSTVVSNVISFVQTNWGTISGIISGVMDGVLTYLQGVWKQISGVVQGAWDVIHGIFDIIKGVLTGDFSEAWTGIQEVIDGVWTAIKGIISGAIDEIAGILDVATGGNLGRIISGVTGAFQTIGSTVSSVFGGIGGVIKGGLNAAIGAINGLISGINMIHISAHVPGWVPGVGGKGFDLGFNIPSIPYLASGGVALGPTLAMIGERGPEAVIPLDQYFGLNGNAEAIANATATWQEVNGKWALVAGQLSDDSTKQAADASEATAGWVQVGDRWALVAGEVSKGAADTSKSADALGDSAEKLATAADKTLLAQQKIEAYQDQQATIAAKAAAAGGQGIGTAMRPPGSGGVDANGNYMPSYSISDAEASVIAAAAAKNIQGNGKINPYLNADGSPNWAAIYPSLDSSGAVLPYDPHKGLAGYPQVTVVNVQQTFHGPTNSDQLKGAMDDWLNEHLTVGAAQHGVAV